MSESHVEYARRVGPPRVGKCDIDLGMAYGPVWFCRTHDYGYDNRGHGLDGYLVDRCPMSRLEEWRSRQWEWACP